MTRIVKRLFTSLGDYAPNSAGLDRAGRKAAREIERVNRAGEGILWNRRSHPSPWSRLIFQ
jgi:hypothetical protein